jgi:hypothetical protein
MLLKYYNEEFKDAWNLGMIVVFTWHWQDEIRSASSLAIYFSFSKTLAL